MAEKEKEPASQSKPLTESDSSDDNEINPRFETSVEERQYNTIPGSAIATHIALSYLRVQVNPTVERGPPCRLGSHMLIHSHLVHIRHRRYMAITCMHEALGCCLSTWNLSVATG